MKPKSLLIKSKENSPLCKVYTATSVQSVESHLSFTHKYLSNNPLKLAQNKMRWSFPPLILLAVPSFSSPSHFTSFWSYFVPIIKQHEAARWSFVKFKTYQDEGGGAFRGQGWAVPQSETKGCPRGRPGRECHRSRWSDGGKIDNEQRNIGKTHTRRLIDL